MPGRVRGAEVRMDAIASVSASVGAGVYWGVSMRSLTGWNRSDAVFERAMETSGLSDIILTCVSQLAIVIVAILLAIFARRMRSARFLSALALIGIAANLTMIFLAVALLFFHISLGVTGAFWAMVVRGVGMAGCITLWGLRFASLDRARAGHEVVFAALVGMILYYAMLLVSPDVGAIVDPLCFALSLGCFLLAGCPVKRTPRDMKREAAPRIARFFGSRVLIGYVLGLSNVLLVAVDPVAVPVPLVVTGLAFAAFCLVWLGRTKDNDVRILPLLPLVAMGLFLLPCSLQRGVPVFNGIVTVLVWFCWIALSSFQLSELKDEFGMDEAVLSSSEKAVIMLMWTIGAVSAYGLRGSALVEEGSIPAYLGVVLVYGMVIFATSSIWGLVYARRRKQIIDELSKPEEERNRELYRALACNYRLTDREREVLELLAEGHTRSYIQDTLGISNGTAKAHTAHLYQKLGIHKKEELLTLVEAARASNAD